MTTDCCNGHEAEIEAEDPFYAERVDIRLRCLQLSLEHLASDLTAESLLDFAREAAEFVLYGATADQDAAHEPEECELLGERPLS